MAILLNPVNVIGSLLNLVSFLQIIDQFDDHMFFYSSFFHLLWSDFFETNATCRSANYRSWSRIGCL